ncbi:flagellar biosynthesis repressor FlbT [Oleomonas cavernae]|uniref:flagellar biosynthesis repressor FlbT n=1 Tax=Oleomonas cavernae TaxID=2320859 RepID=UPI001313F575|nr:flagellar biosynthesis repressor FlbT [Oleomonas cavernae]
MPLKITLAPEEKIIVNGVVIANAGGPATLSVLNRAQILRGKDILAAEDAQTPATRIYYVLQCLYLFPDRAADYQAAAKGFLADYAAAAPSAAATIAEITEQLATRQIYPALKTAKKLLAHEKEIFAHVPDPAPAHL